MMLCNARNIVTVSIDTVLHDDNSLHTIGTGNTEIVLQDGLEVSDFLDVVFSIMHHNLGYSADSIYMGIKDIVATCEAENPDCKSLYTLSKTFHELYL